MENRRTKVEPNGEIRREYEHGAGTIRGVLAYFEAEEPNERYICQRER